MCTIVLRDIIHNLMLLLFFRGGFAVVHRCVHRESGKMFAVKIINVGYLRKQGIILLL